MFAEGPVAILAVDYESKQPLSLSRGPTQKVWEDSLVRVHQGTNERPPPLSGFGAAIEEAHVVKGIRNSRPPGSSSSRDSGEFLYNV
jgi:hypothetical protein